MSFAAIAIGVGAAVSAGAGIYEANKQGQVANSALGLAYDTEAKQDQYNQMLMSLMGNPSSFLSNPLFQSSLNQGLKGVSRQQAASGFKGSGNEATALEAYGQTFAFGQLQQQESLLASLSGAGAAGTPGSSLGTAGAATSAQANSLNSLAGLIAFAGKSGIFGTSSSGGGGSTGGDINDPSSGGFVGPPQG